MDLAIVGWIALGWFAVALILSVALGGFLRKASESPNGDDLAEAATRQKSMRFLRGRNSMNTCGKATVSRVRVLGKRAIG